MFKFKFEIEIILSVMQLVENYTNCISTMKIQKLNACNNEKIDDNNNNNNNNQQ